MLTRLTSGLPSSLRLVRGLILGGGVVVLVVFAAVALTSLASASEPETESGPQSDDAWLWSHHPSNENGSGPDFAVKFNTAGNAPNSISLPTAVFTNTPTPVSSSYQFTGHGVTLKSQTLTTTTNGVDVSYTSFYFDLGNGITYKWRANAYTDHTWYSDIDVKITVAAVTKELDVSQTTTTFTMVISTETKYVLYGATGGTTPYTYTVHDGHTAPVSATAAATQCAHHTDGTQRATCVDAADGTTSAATFTSSAPIVFDAGTLTFQLKDAWHKIRQPYTASPSDLGDYNFTLLATDSTGAVTTVALTVTVEAHSLFYEKNPYFQEPMETWALQGGNTIVWDIEPAKGGIGPIAYSVDCPPSGFTYTQTQWTYVSGVLTSPDASHLVTIWITATDSSTPAATAQYPIYITVDDWISASTPGWGLMTPEQKAAILQSQNE